MEEIVIDFNQELNKILVYQYQLRCTYFNVLDGEDFDDFTMDQKNKLLDNLHNEIEHINTVLKEGIDDEL